MLAKAERDLLRSDSCFTQAVDRECPICLARSPDCMTWHGHGWLCFDECGGAVGRIRERHLHLPRPGQAPPP